MGGTPLKQVRNLLLTAEKGISRLHCHALLGVAKARIKVEVEEPFSCHSDRLLGWPFGLGQSIGHLVHPQNQN